MSTSIKLKKIVLKFFASLILSLIITLLNEGIPKKKFSEYNVSAYLSENIRLLILLLPADKRHSLKTIFLSEQSEVRSKFASNTNTINQCSIATVNNDKIISAKLTQNSLNLDFIINDNFNESNCNEAIKKQLNEMLRIFIQSLMQDQIKIYQQNLSLIESSEDNKAKVIEKILTEIKKENNNNININLLQSNLMDTENLIGQKNVIDTFQKILNVKHPFSIYGEKISIKKTYPSYLFIFCFVFIFFILNYSLFHKYLKKILS